MGWRSEGDQLQLKTLLQQGRQFRWKKNTEVREMNTIITSLEGFI